MMSLSTSQLKRWRLSGRGGYRLVWAVFIAGLCLMMACGPVRRGGGGGDDCESDQDCKRSEYCKFDDVDDEEGECTDLEGNNGGNNGDLPFGNNDQDNSGNNDQDNSGNNDPNNANIDPNNANNNDPNNANNNDPNNANNNDPNNNPNNVNNNPNNANNNDPNNANNNPNVCDGNTDCEAWEECCDGLCVERGECDEGPNTCRSDDDCEAWEVCCEDICVDREQCDEGPSTCRSDDGCEAWEECCDGACVERGSCDEEPPEEGTCGGFFDCVGACEEGDEACQEDCFNQLSGEEQEKVFDLQDCLDRNGCYDESTDDGFQECANTNCSTEINNCFGGVGPNDTNVGSSCDTDSDCDGGELQAFCQPELNPDTQEDTGFVDGYCIAGVCVSDEECGTGNHCVAVGQENPQNLCLAGCNPLNGRDDCRFGYGCWAINEAGDQGVCFPECASDADCQQGRTCTDFTGACE